MGKRGQLVYILTVVLLVFIIIYKIIFLNNLEQYALITNTIFWVLFALITYGLFGFVRDKNYLKPISIKVVIIVLLLYFLVIYLLGFFIGFGYSAFRSDTFERLKQIALFVFLITGMEISRYNLLKKCTNKAQIILITLEFIILSIIIGINGQDMSSYKNIFIITSTIILPIIANEALCSYITYEISFVPSLIYKLVLQLYIYLVPLLPALGNYINAVTDLILPFAIYMEIRKGIKYKELYSRKARKTLKKAVLAIVLSFLITMVALVSGFFKYQIIAIITNSMNPTYSRGDAVIIQKKDAKDIKEGEVLAFNLGNGIVTHRVVEINYENNTYSFVTKGDGNDYIDTYDIKDENVIGTVNYILKYAGFPTVWMNELFERRG